MNLHFTAAELRQKADHYRRRAIAARDQAQAVVSRAAQSSFLSAARTWDRLADAREFDADLLSGRSDGGLEFWR